MSKVFEIAFKLGGELTSSFKSAFSGANGAMKTLGAAAAALGGAAAFSAMAGQVVAMEEDLSKLSAQTGTYGKEMQELGEIAKNVFKQGHGESFNDVTAALTQVKQNMQGLDQGELQRVTGDAMQLANTFDAEVNEVTRAANNLMTNFGIDSTKAFDMMAKGAQNGLNFSNEMFDNLSEYSPLWGDMGYSAEEMFGILQAGAKNGVYNLDYLNDVMKEFQIRSTDGSKATNEAVAALGPEVQKVWKAFSNGEASVADMSQIAVTELSKISDKVKQNELGVALFGTKWEDLGGDVVLSMLAAGQSLTDFEGSMQKINEVRFDTVGAALKGIGRTLLIDLVMPLGDAALPMLNKVANYLQNNLSSAMEKTKNIVSDVAPVVVGLGVAFITYQATLKTVALAQSAFNAVQLLTPKLLYAHRTALLAYTFAGGGVRGVLVAMRSAMAALNITMLANPIGLTIAVLVGLATALAVAYKTSEKFRSVVDKSFTAVKDVVVNVSDSISTIATTMWDSVVSSAKELPARISSALSGSAVGKVLSGLFSGDGIVDGLIQSFKNGFSSLPGLISMVAPMMTTIGLGFLGVTGPIGLVIGAVVSLVGFIYRLSQTNDSVASGISSAWSTLSTAFAPIIEVFSQSFGNFASEIGPEVTKTLEVIASSIAGLAPSFATLGATLAEIGPLLFSLMIENATMLATTVLPVLMQVFQTVLPIIGSLISSIVPIILQLVQTIIPLILSVVQMVFPVVLQIIQSVLPIVATLLMTVAGVILQLVQTLIPLILSVVQMVFPIVLGIIQAIIPVIAAILQVLVTVISTVLIPAINAILAVIQFVFPLIQLIIQNALTIVNGIIQAAMALLKGDWDGAWNAIKGTAETIMNNIIAFFKGINLFEVGKSVVTGLINGIKSMGSSVVGAITDMVPAPLRSAATGLMGKLGIGGYAVGGIVRRPELAWVGEGGDTESIIPWNNSQRSKDLWLQTGQALGMLNSNGALGNMQQQIMLRQQGDAAPAVIPELVGQTMNSSYKNSEIIVQYSPQYNVQSAADLEQVKQHADQDKDDLAARLAEIKRNEERTSFGD